MRRPPIALEQIHIPHPCSADWATMRGDGSKRFCELCNKHVHDIATMPREAAERLIARGNACVRLTISPQGRVITRERPWWRPGRWAAALWMSIGSVLALVGSEKAYGSSSPKPERITTERVAMPGMIAAPALADAPPVVLAGEPVVILGAPPPPTSQPTTRATDDDKPTEGKDGP